MCDYETFPEGGFPHGRKVGGVAAKCLSNCED